MTSANDQFGRIARQGQEAVTNAVKMWTDSVQRLTGGSAGGQAPDVSAVVDSAFDFAERMLRTQREFTKSVLQAVQGTTARVTDAAVQGLDQSAQAGARAGRGASNDAVDLAQATSRSAADATEQASGAARGAAQGAASGAQEGAERSGSSSPASRRSSRS